MIWAFGLTLLGLDDTRTTGITVLLLGFAASAVAVVPGFGQLIHGDNAYLAMTSGLGVVALTAGVLVVLISANLALTVLMVVMIVLWAVSTAHHVAQLKGAARTDTGVVRSGSVPRQG